MHVWVSCVAVEGGEVAVAGSHGEDVVLGGAWGKVYGSYDFLRVPVDVCQVAPVAGRREVFSESLDDFSLSWCRAVDDGISGWLPS